MIFNRQTSTASPTHPLQKEKNQKKRTKRKNKTNKQEFNAHAPALTRAHACDVFLSNLLSYLTPGFKKVFLKE